METYKIIETRAKREILDFGCLGVEFDPGRSTPPPLLLLLLLLRTLWIIHPDELL